MNLEYGYIGDVNGREVGLRLEVSNIVPSVAWRTSCVNKLYDRMRGIIDDHLTPAGININYDKAEEAANMWGKSKEDYKEFVSQNKRYEELPILWFGHKYATGFEQYNIHKADYRYDLYWIDTGEKVKNVAITFASLSSSRPWLNGSYINKSQDALPARVFLAGMERMNGQRVRLGLPNEKLQVKFTKTEEWLQSRVRIFDNDSTVQGVTLEGIKPLGDIVGSVHVSEDSCIMEDFTRDYEIRTSMEWPVEVNGTEYDFYDRAASGMQITDKTSHEAFNSLTHTIIPYDDYGYYYSNPDDTNFSDNITDPRFSRQAVTMYFDDSSDLSFTATSSMNAFWFPTYLMAWEDPEITIDKKVNGKKTEQVSVGDTVTYTVQIAANNIRSDYVTVTDSVPNGIDVSNIQVECNGNREDDRVTFQGKTISLKVPNGTTKLIYTGKATTAGTHVNTAKVEDIADKEGNPIESEAIVEAIEKTPVVTLEKTVNDKKSDNAKVGDKVDYKVVITASNLTENIDVTDIIPDGINVTNVKARTENTDENDNVSVDIDGKTITASIPNGTTTITYEGIVVNAGEHINTASVNDPKTGEPIKSTATVVTPGTLIEKHQTEDGVDLIEPMETTKPVGTPYTTTEKEFAGYKIKAVPDNAVGEYAKETTIVTYIYAKVPAQVIVHYVDEDGNSLTNDVNIDGKVGDIYATEQKTFDNYDFVKTIGDPTSGTMAEEDKDVTYVYKLKEGTLTVKHVTADGKELKAPVTTTEKVGTPYATHDEKFDGYRLVSMPENKDGEYKVTPIEVTYIYAPIPAKVNVIHVDEEGNSVASGSSKDGNVGDPYETLPADPEGYKLIKTPDNAKGTMTEEPIDVIYVYAKKPGALEVNYVDEDGKPLAEQDKTEGKMGDPYKAMPKDISGYELVKVEGKEEGLLPNGTEVVTYIYKRISAKLTVNYVDEDGKPLTPKDESTGFVGDPYQTTPKEIEGYTIKKVEGNETGALTKDPTVVTYIYSPIKDDITTTTSDPKPMIEKTVSKKNAQVGDIVTYTIKAKAEEGILLNAVVTDKMPEGVKLVKGSMKSEGKVDEENMTVKADRLTYITITYDAKVVKEGTHENIATLTGSNTDKKVSDKATVTVSKSSAQSAPKTGDKALIHLFVGVLLIAAISLGAIIKRRYGIR